MSAVTPPSRPLRLAIALALGLGLAACSDKQAPAPTDAKAPVVAAQAAAQAAANQEAQQQAAALAALSPDELRTRGRQALREQRIYTPAGNNAMEYYIALRKKSEKPDASAESALMDLAPYAVIAAEQALAKEDFIEADRLRQLIAAADPQAPSLARIGDAITKGKEAVANRATQDASKTAEQAAAAETARLKALADEKKAAAAAATAAAAPSRSEPAPAAAPPPVRETAPPPAPVAAAQPPPQRPATPAAAPPRASSGDLVPVSTPQPAYPPQAQRLGTAGEVVVSFTVNSDGSVSNVEIVSAKPRGVFERNVQTAVRKWRFQPISGSQNVTRTFNFAR